MKILPKFLAMVSILVSAAFLAAYNTYETIPSPNGWPMAGQNKQNTGFQSREHIIGPANVSQLTKKWIYNTDANSVQVNQAYPKSGVLGTPSVDKLNRTVYFGDLNGRLHAVDAQTGKPVWVKSIVYDYLADIAAKKGLNIANMYVFTRTTPLIFGNSLIIGLRNGCPSGSLTCTPTFDTEVAIGGGMVIAVSRIDGHLLWRNTVAPTTVPLGNISTSLTLFGNIVYSGITDLNEEGAGTDSASQAAITRIYQALGAPLPAGGTYHCCSSNGVVFALNATTGQLIFAVPTIDPSVPRGYGGWSGASAWGMTNPPVDLAKQTVYFSTGNLYNVSADAATQTCLQNAGSNRAARNACMPSGVHQDAIMALNFKTGAIKWTKNYFPIDVGGAACIGASFGAPGTGCNDPLAFPGNVAYLSQSYADADFGQNPMLAEVNGVQTMFISQKSGNVFSINPSTGQVNWTASTGPGTLYGGSEFGSATDGIRIYNQNTNGAVFLPDFSFYLTPVTLINEFTPTPTGPGGFFSAVNAANGQIVWQTRDPNALTINPKYIIHASPYGGITTANGVVYGASVNHTLLAMSAATGQILWQNNTDVTGAGFAPPAIVQGTVYWPTGQTPVTIAPGSPTTPVDANDPYSAYDNKVIAFSLPSCAGDLDNNQAQEDDNEDTNNQ